MSDVADEADALVCKVRAGRISARDALRILKRLEEVAKPEEAERMKQARAIIEDAMATVREMGTLLRLRTFHSRFVQRDRRARIRDATAEGKRMERIG